MGQKRRVYLPYLLCFNITLYITLHITLCFKWRYVKSPESFFHWRCCCCKLFCIISIVWLQVIKVSRIEQVVLRCGCRRTHTKVKLLTLSLMLLWLCFHALCEDEHRGKVIIGYSSLFQKTKIYKGHWYHCTLDQFFHAEQCLKAPESSLLLSSLWQDTTQ